MSDETVKKEKKKGGRIVLAICIVVIIALCILIYFLLHKDDPPKRDVVVNEDNVEEILSQMEGVEPGTRYTLTLHVLIRKRQFWNRQLSQLEVTWIK